MFFRAPVRMVFIPITHDLVHAATVHHARKSAHILDEVTKERGARYKFLVVVVDIAVQRLVQCIDEFCQATDLQARCQSTSEARLHKGETRRNVFTG